MRLDDAFMFFIALPVGVVILLVSLYGIFVLAPVSVYTEAECLESGYPKSSVTWNLKRYCMSLDGAVTISVHKAGKK